MNNHIVRAFDEDLGNLKTKIAQMGGLAEDQLARAIDALSRRDIELANAVIDADAKIDTLESEIEEHAITTIARRQPMASDLRALIVAIRISSDLERIGDLAKNIAKRTHGMTDTLPRSIGIALRRMTELCHEQLSDVLDAYSRGDDKLAVRVWESDRDIDALYNSVFRELLTYMMEDPRTIGMSTHLLFGAKNLERIGDHTTNIAENVYYLVRGTTIEGERPKTDHTSMATIEAPGGD